MCSAVSLKIDSFLSYFRLFEITLLCVNNAFVTEWGRCPTSTASMIQLVVPFPWISINQRVWVFPISTYACLVDFLLSLRQHWSISDKEQQPGATAQWHTKYKKAGGIPLVVSPPLKRIRQWRGSVARKCLGWSNRPAACRLPHKSERRGWDSLCRGRCCCCCCCRLPVLLLYMNIGNLRTHKYLYWNNNGAAQNATLTTLLT